MKFCDEWRQTGTWNFFVFFLSLWNFCYFSSYEVVYVLQQTWRFCTKQHNYCRWYSSVTVLSKNTEDFTLKTTKLFYIFNFSTFKSFYICQMKWEIKPLKDQRRLLLSCLFFLQYIVLNPLSSPAFLKETIFLFILYTENITAATQERHRSEKESFDQFQHSFFCLWIKHTKMC